MSYSLELLKEAKAEALLAFDPVAARARFIEVVAANPLLTAHLFDEATIREAASQWFGPMLAEEAKMTARRGARP